MRETGQEVGGDKGKTLKPDVFSSLVQAVIFLQSIQGSSLTKGRQDGAGAAQESG